MQHPEGVPFGNDWPADPWPERVNTQWVDAVPCAFCNPSDRRLAAGTLPVEVGNPPRIKFRPICDRCALAFWAVEARLARQDAAAARELPVVVVGERGLLAAIDEALLLFRQAGRGFVHAETLGDFAAALRSRARSRMLRAHDELAALGPGAAAPLGIRDDRAEATQAAVGAWAEATFPHSTPGSVVAHLKREVAELSDALDWGATENDVMTEAADCSMLLKHLAHKLGADLAAFERDKFAVNRGRTWGPVDAEGVSEHVEPASE